MNQAQAPGHPPVKPPLGNTGQYTISVSKPGTGEDAELPDKRLNLTVQFTTPQDTGLFIPDACRIDIRRNSIEEGIDQNFPFVYQDGAYVADVAMTLEEDLQATWWIDLYLLKGDSEKYAFSAYLSTLLVDLMTVTCAYRSDFPSDGRDG
ncbi:MAG TPA: hypothetical protein VF646_05340 [Cytophagales bacterium]